MKMDLKHDAAGINLKGSLKVVLVLLYDAVCDIFKVPGSLLIPEVADQSPSVVKPAAGLVQTVQHLVSNRQSQ